MVEKLSFNVSNFLQQKFPFPLKLINYVNKEADAEVKQKLDRTCKHFYKALPFCIIDTLEIKNSEDGENMRRIENVQYDGCIDFTEEFVTFLFKAANIWITKKLDATYIDDFDTWIFDKIVRCDAPEISLINYDITFELLKTLTKSGNVESFDLSDSTVENSDKSLVPLEDVLALVPNARMIRMNNCHITKETMTKLLTIPWKNKLTEFSLTGVDAEFNAKLFFQFLNKHVDPDAYTHVYLHFQRGFRSWATRPLESLFQYSFEKLYYKLLDSGEKLPTLNNISPKYVAPTMLSFYGDIFTTTFQFIQNKLGFKNAAKKTTFNEDDMERQYLAFPYPHMCYIRESVDAETMKKLEQTCKFFHKRNPFLIVDDLHITGDHTLHMVMNTKKITLKNEASKMGKLLWVTNSLVFNCICHGFSNIGRMEAKEIKMKDAVVPFEIFKMLTSSGLAKNWNSIEGFINSTDGEIITLEELLFHLPNAEIIRAKVHGINSRYPILWNFELQPNKIKHLQLQFNKQPIIAEFMFDVLRYFLAPKAQVKLEFSEMPAEEMDVDLFKAQMKAKMDSWKPQIDKPTFKIIS